MERILNLFDRYKLEAGFFPAVLASLPLWILLFSIQDVVSSSSIITKIVSSSALVLVFAYLAADIVRNLGKNFEQKAFEGEENFPTTDLLLFSNGFFSKEKKEAIYNKIKTEFGISLPNRNEQSKDEKNARKRVSEAVGEIRQKLDKGRLLINYNNRYGFWRNLIGSSPFSASLCIFVGLILIFLQISFLLGLLTLIISLPYFFLWLYRKQIIAFFAKEYARQLYFEFLSEK